MFRRTLQFCLLSTVFYKATALINERDFKPSEIIIKDVIIIGGGASGTYAAVRLREDLNTSVVVIEPKGRLGGHVDTYTVPETDTTLEYGVQSYMPYGPTPGFFERFGVETKAFAARRLTAINVDIETGKPLVGYTAPSNDATTEALKRWLQFVEKYESFVEPGYWNFPSPDSIPAELFEPFAEIAKKHGIEAAVPRIAGISGVGSGGLGKILTLDMLQGFGPVITRDVISGTLVNPVVSNSLLYQRAYELLKNDVYLESSIQQTERTPSGVRVVVKTPAGEVLIKAKQALWTPYPSQGINLQNFDEDQKETQVFKGWNLESSFVGVATVPCLPENYSLAFIPSAAAPSNYLAIRDYPYTLRLDSTGPSGLKLFRVLFSTNYSITYEGAKEMIRQNVEKVVQAGALNYTGECEVNFKAFSDHTGVLWPQGEEHIKSGFVQRLYGLQGYRSTWWTGRSFSQYYSSSVWAFTDTVLERMLKELKE